MPFTKNKKPNQKSDYNVKVSNNNNNVFIKNKIIILKVIY